MSSPCGRFTRNQASNKQPKGKSSPKTSKGKTTKSPKSVLRSDSPYLPRKVKLEPNGNSKDLNPSKLSISHPEIKINGDPNPLELNIGGHGDDTPLSMLDELFSESSNESTENVSQNDTLGDMEINSDELSDAPLPLLAIPEATRTEAGPNWRMKEALLNSYHFGKPTISASEFARSQSETKTAEVLADTAHSLESKKYYVKIHLGRFSFIMRRCLGIYSFCTIMVLIISSAQSVYLS